MTWSEPFTFTEQTLYPPAGLWVDETTFQVFWIGYDYGLHSQKFLISGGAITPLGAPVLIAQSGGGEQVVEAIRAPDGKIVLRIETYGS